MDNTQLISILQTVISPVVLISGVGMLVLSMTNRFSHATDRLRLLSDARRKIGGVARERVESQMRVVYQRLRLLQIAIASALGTVLCTALLIIIFFSNYLFATSFHGPVVVLFSLSLFSLVLSLCLFIRDMSLSLTALREDLDDVL